MVLIYQRQVEKGEQILNAAEKHLSKLNDPSLLCDLYNLWGEAYLTVEQLPRAAQLFDKALALNPK